MASKKTSFTTVDVTDSFIVIDKPAGMLSIPDRENEGNSLLDKLRTSYPDVLTVHRLDKDTSGLMIFALNEDAHRYFSKKFADREVEKRYRALLQGQLFVSEGTIDSPLAQTSGGKMAVRRDGRPSVTHYKVIEKYRSATYVDVELVTGRMHQIRIHFSSIGYPLLVDPVYGRQDVFYLSDIKLKNYKLKKDSEERPLLSRQPLHAHYLSFTGPDEKVYSYESPLPKDIKATITQLGKWNSV